MEGIYRIADRTILIRTLHAYTHIKAAAFAAEGTADFTVEIAQADIDAERIRNARTDEAEGRGAKVVTGEADEAVSGEIIVPQMSIYLVKKP